MTTLFWATCVLLWHGLQIDQYLLAADSNVVAFIASLQAGLAHVAAAFSAGHLMSYVFTSQPGSSSRASLPQE